MRKEIEKRIGLSAAAVLVASELSLWISPKAGWAVLRTPEYSIGYFVGALLYSWLFYSIWYRNKRSYEKYLILMFLSEAIYNIATFDITSYATLPFYSAVGIGALGFL